MEYHKTLNRQIKKLIPQHIALEDLKPFLDAVNRSYDNFERDKLLSQHSFKIAESEYNQVNQKLLEEKKTQEKGIKNILEAIAALDDGSPINIKENENELLIITEFLNKQIKKQIEVERKLKLAIKKAKKASSAKSDFLSVMSHEIRSPLNLIVGISHVLQKNESLPSQKGNLEILDIASKNLLSLINNILDFNKIEEGKVELSHSKTDIYAMLEMVIKANKNFADEKENELKFRIDKKVNQFCLLDQIRFNQILNNLVSNAIKFTKNGKVEIIVNCLEDNEDEQLLRFAVKDSGIGISKEDQKIILERFTQASKDIASNYGGTGLGLSITKLLLKLMSSDINIESTPGKGSTFYFDIYLSKSIGDDAFIEDPDFQTKDLRGAKILIVDDIEFNLVLLEEILGDWNTELTKAFNGKEALELAKTNPYDCILMDLQMPVMDGKQATNEIRKFNTTIPIIALTASSNDLTKKQVEAVGMNEYVTKPFNPENLYNKLWEHTVNHKRVELNHHQ